MENKNEWEFGLMRLAPELQVKVFEALPSPQAATDLALTCRALNALFATYQGQILAAIRDTMVAPFYEYYAFLSRLHIPASDIKHPPPGGWPNITRENCAGLDKTEFAVDVLQHLPYIAEGRPPNAIDHMCPVVDYSTATRADLADGLEGGEQMPAILRRPVSGRHRVAIAQTHHRSHGVDLLLDTRAGVVIEEAPRSLRVAETLPVREYFAAKMRACRELRLVFAPGGYAYLVGDDCDEQEPPYDAAVMERIGEPVCPSLLFDLSREIDRDWVRHLYRKFGWPAEDWRKEEGLKAIMEYRDRRDAEAQVWVAEARRRRTEAMMQRVVITVGVLRRF